mmetsp:Transcript_18034/g.39187  ORF Transcript_18034/g.39187 Transcript_18034/m.39187 type:complete len:178 (-) Transcript_18034:75-608(-)
MEGPSPVSSPMTPLTPGAATPQKHTIRAQMRETMKAKRDQLRTAAKKRLSRGGDGDGEGEAEARVEPVDAIDTLMHELATQTPRVTVLHARDYLGRRDDRLSGAAESGKPAAHPQVTAAACPCCSRPFWALRRRLRCAVCEQDFCCNCGDFWMAIPFAKTARKERVCEVCRELLEEN